MSLGHGLAIARERSIHALDGQDVVIDGPANLQRGWESVGGWLALSSDWLVFTSHRFNWQVGRVLIPTSMIRRAYLCRIWLFGVLPVFPKSMAVETKTGRVYRFIVFYNLNWIDALRWYVSEPPTTDI
jgi:hypothetical protein